MSDVNFHKKVMQTAIREMIQENGGTPADHEVLLPPGVREVEKTPLQVMQESADEDEVLLPTELNRRQNFAGGQASHHEAAPLGEPRPGMLKNQAPEEPPLMPIISGK